MKRSSYVFLAVLLTAPVLFCACQNAENLKKDAAAQNSSTESGVSFTSFSPRSVSVTNNTGERLIAFKGAIKLSSLIGGVPPNASNHGLELKQDLFSETGDFPLLFLTEKVFNENKDNLSAVKNLPFASVYAFYNKNGSNDLVYSISSASGGSGKLVLQNNSPFNVEIHNKSPNGEVIGYVGAYTANTVINLNPDDYTFYPVFRKYIERDNEIYTVVPKFNDQTTPYYEEFAITDEETFDVGKIWDATKLELSSGGFYLTINNQSGTAIRFMVGTKTHKTSTGLKGIPSGKSVTFFVPFTEKTNDGWYPAQMLFNTLKIGTSINPFPISEKTFKRDTKYQITVTGPDAKNLVLGAVEEVGAVNINKLFGL